MDALLFPVTAACYLYGAIPFSHVFTYLASGKRIDEAGSRNIGVSNAFVVGGLIAGSLTVCGEVSKVLVCIAAADVLFGGSIDIVLLLVFSAFVGTLFSVFLKGRGSVGSTMQGFALLILSTPTAIVFCIAIGVVYWLLKDKRRVPIIAEALLPVMLLLIEQTVGWVLFGLCTAFLFVLKYRTRHDDVEYLPWRGGTKPRVRRAYVRGIAQADGAQIGGKARSLRYLKAHKFTIPHTYVCGLDAYERYRAGSPEVLGQVAEELAALVGEHSYAVRSSANVEDGVEYSFAGQFKSFLHVRGVKSLVEAIEAVWQSTSSNRVRAYAEKTGAPIGDLRMAVIIQEMIEPQLSGVVFSKNPSTGLDEVIVETVQGLGTQLVSHGTTPDKWVYKWGRWTEEPAEREDDLAIIEEVVRGAQKAERRCGGAVNLEWAFDGERLYWLQLRKLTTIEGVNIYSNRIAKEFLPGMIKPLVWSINVPTVNSSWKRLFVELIGDAARGINIDQLARAFYYRAYFNMGVIGDLFALLGMPRESIELLLGIDVPGGDPPRPRPSLKTIKYLPRALLFAARRVRILKDMDAFLVRQRTAYERFASVLRKELSEGELFECVNKLLTANKEASYFVITSQLLLGLVDMLVNKLVRGPTSVSALDFKYMQGERQDIDPSYHLSQLHNYFLTLPGETQEKVREITYDDLAHSNELHDFFVHLTQFLNTFGHVSDSGNDFSQVSWKESPDHIIKLIIDYGPPERVANDAPPFTEEPGWQGAKRTERLLYGQEAKVRVYKEQIGFLYAYGIGLFRDYFLQLGKVLAKKGIFEAPNDIFYLTFEEVARTVSMRMTPEEGRGSIAERKAEMEKYADAMLPEVIIGEEAPPMQPKKVLHWLKGVAASTGYYQGRVTTLSGVQDVQKIQDGDVLVIPYSDVGWTPLFVHAGAVISGAGGMLSHAAIVAREYRIPAVVSLRGINNLADGTTVAVDGFKGEVLIIPTQH